MDKDQDTSQPVDADGIPVIPRFSFSIPKECCHDFLQHMQEEDRGSAGELLTAIVKRYFRRLRAERMVKEMNATEQPQEARSIPSYGLRKSMSNADQGKVQNEDR